MKNVTIAGRLGRDAVLRSADGTPVLNFSVAVSDHKKDAPAHWFDCALWGARAERIEPYMKKGTQVALSGDLGRREHDGKTYFTVRVSELTFMGGGERSGPSASEYRAASSGGGTQSFAQDLDDAIPF